MVFPTSLQQASPEWRRTFETIKAGHDEAYRTIERAIKLEEHERPDLALQAYKDGIRQIDETLALPVEVPQGPVDTGDGSQRQLASDESWQQAIAMIHKLKRTRGEVLQRVGQLGGGAGDAASEDGGTLSSSAGQRPWTYTELAMALREMSSRPSEPPENRDGEESSSSSSSSSRLELLFSCPGVQVYYIEPDGVVSHSMADSTLRIVRIEADERRRLQETVFLQVIETRAATRIESAEEPLLVEAEDVEEATEDGEPPVTRAMVVEEVSEERESSVPSAAFFLYPLIPGVSPCYRTEYGAFILPDLQTTAGEEHAPRDGRAIGLVVPPGADEVVLEILIALLHGIVTQPSDARIRKRSLRLPDSNTVSAGIIRGAYYVSRGLVRGAERTGQLIATGTPYVISKLGPKATDQSATEAEPTVHVPPTVRTGIEMARSVTGTAAGVTSYVAGKVGSATMALGRFLAPHIQRHGSALLAYGTGMSEAAASERMNGALTICAGAVEGFGTVYEGLERSAGILGKSLSSSTVQIVEHRYGTEAGQVVGSGLDTVGNVINVTHNINYITPKGLAKRTAKNAGKALVAGYRPPVPEVDALMIEPGSSGNAIASSSAPAIVGASSSSSQSVTTVPAAILYPDLDGLAKQMRQLDGM
ncbi:protein spartin [Anopheles bellator]|uniref:protein spartin n=1 Tax=Anopheles bellator TaxID=139047 RepID=UPI0026472978|nr:protein spartin [Anopheles bellator]